jgi:hypothetical protein
MKNIDIEERISSDDSLYYWAMSYCKDNKCTVNEFIRKNKKFILEKISKEDSTKKSRLKQSV